ncbi:DUF2946 family protein [Limnohabitans sp.]|uniref:DUF2946 family protein n=1 Tax=Limnohabitans sp. TaxID=1907725 RepID=UPI00311D4AA3
MQTLRNARFLARLVLAWMVLFVGIAVASPLVKPVSLEVVCSAAAGTHIVVVADDGTPSDQTTGMHCPLCLPLSAPPAAALTLPAAQTGLSYALHPLESARLQSLIGQPWQARAPPRG